MKSKSPARRGVQLPIRESFGTTNMGVADPAQPNAVETAEHLLAAPHPEDVHPSRPGRECPRNRVTRLIGVHLVVVDEGQMCPGRLGDPERPLLGAPVVRGP